MIPSGRLPRRKMKVPMRAMRHAYDDRASLEGRRLVGDSH
jgi:hypothetical protein